MASPTRSDGEGSIYYDRARERYVGSYVTGWQDGKPTRKKVSAPSRAGAASKLRKLREQIEREELPVGSTPTVERWMTHWLDNIAAKKVRPSTLRGYRTKVDRYIIPILGSKRIDKLTPEHVADAWAQIMEHGCPDENGKPVKGAAPLTSTSAHQAHRILARALKVAQQRGHVTRNVATLIDAPQPREAEMELLTKAQAQALMAAAKGRRNAARWTVALALGLRQGEALGLTWDHVDLEAGTIAVRQSLGKVKGQGLVLGPVKSRAGRRILAMPAPLLADLKAHRKAQAEERLAAGSWWHTTDHQGFVFARVDGRPINPRDDWQAWKDLLREAGLPDRSLHSARHTAATMLLLMEVQPRAVMEILGHSRITVTQKYQHVVDEMHREVADKMAEFWA